VLQILRGNQQEKASKELLTRTSMECSYIQYTQYLIRNTIYITYIGAKYINSSSIWDLTTN